MSAWRGRGSPTQRGIRWRKRDWIEAFPEHEDRLGRLPSTLDRADVQAIATDALLGPTDAEFAFLVVKALGEGDNGYGPSRARESIELTDRPGERLLAVAETLRDRGALAAYARLTDRGDCRVFNLGPAFGTKYLYFTQPTSHRPQALIWDKNIAHWFHTHAGVPRFTAWSLRRYTVFLSQMHAWAEALRCEPDEVELCMFRSALNSSNQWKDD